MKINQFLFILVIFALSISCSENTEVSGGCTAQIGTLSPQSLEEITDISNRTDTEKDMKLLSELYEFLEKDSTHKNNARPLIQKVLVTVSDKHEFEFIEEVKDNVASLLDYYIEPTMYPKFSYEASICRELELIFFRTMKDDLFEKSREAMKKADWNSSFQIMEEAKITQTKMNSVMLSKLVQGMIDLNEKQLDVCARKRCWEFAERLLGGGFYYEGKGVEINEEIVQALKKAYKKEKHKVIREIAANVISKIEGETSN